MGSKPISWTCAPRSVRHDFYLTNRANKPFQRALLFFSNVIVWVIGISKTSIHKSYSIFDFQIFMTDNLHQQQLLPPTRSFSRSQNQNRRNSTRSTSHNLLLRPVITITKQPDPVDTTRLREIQLIETKV